MIINDVITAFTMALFLQLFTLLGKKIRKFIILVFSYTGIFTYFICGGNIDFIGNIDLAIWILLIIIFDSLIPFIVKYFRNINKKVEV